MLAVGDGALGFWSAVREAFPETREQRCWWHKIGNVLNALPKSAQPGAKKALAEMWNAEDKDHAQAAANVFAADYGTKWPKAAARITDDLPSSRSAHDAGLAGRPFCPLTTICCPERPRGTVAVDPCEGPGPEGPATPSSRGILGFARSIFLRSPVRE